MSMNPGMAPPDTSQNRVASIPGNVNKRILGITLVIVSVGILHAWTAKPPQGITRIVLGGYILMLILSVLDLFGGQLSDLATAIAMLAMVTVLLLEGIPILQQASGSLGTSTPKKTAL